MLACSEYQQLVIWLRIRRATENPVHYRINHHVMSGANHSAKDNKLQEVQAQLEGRAGVTDLQKPPKMVPPEDECDSETRENPHEESFPFVRYSPGCKLNNMSL